MSEPPAQPRSLVRVAFVGAAWLSVLNAIAGLVLLGLNAWLNRALPDAPLAMGTWNLVLRLLLLTSLIFEGGIPAAIMQHETLSRGALAALSWLQLLMGLIGASLLLICAAPLAGLWPDYPQDELAGALRLAAPVIALVALGLPPKAVMESRLRFRTSAQIEAGCTLLFIAVAATFASTLGVKALILGMILRHGIEALLYWVFSSMRIADLFVRFDWATVKERLRFGSSMALQSLLGTSMRQADGLLVGFLAGPIVGGIYGQLQNLVVQPFAKLTLFVARAAFPTFARAKDDRERLLRGLAKMQRLVALSVFPALVGMAAVAPRMLRVLLGEQYAEYLAGTVPAFQILCVGALVFTYGYSTGVALNAIGLSRRMLTRQALGGLGVLLLVAVGANWGLLGVSIGRALASIAIAILYIDLARRVLGFSVRIAATGVREAAPAAIACFLAAWSVGLLGDRLFPASSAFAAERLGSSSLLWGVLLAQVMAGALAYAAALMVAGLRPVQEWRALRGEI